MQNNKATDQSIDLGWLIDSPERMLSWGRQADRSAKAAATLRQYIYMQMAASDLVLDEEARLKVDLPEGLLANLEEKNRLLSLLKAPIDQRIESFLAGHFAELKLEAPLQLPSMTLVLDHHGLARQLSLPDGGERFENELVASYRVANGVLHNPVPTDVLLKVHFTSPKVACRSQVTNAVFQNTSLQSSSSTRSPHLKVY